jgi:hypothetical protein
VLIVVNQEEEREKNEWDLRREWAAHKFCMEMLGSNEHLPPPGWRDPEMYAIWRKKKDCPYFPAGICKPTKLDSGGYKVDVDLDGIIPFPFDLSTADYDEFLSSVPLFAVVVKTPLFFPFLCGEKCGPYISSWDLIAYYSKAWRFICSHMEVPDQILRGMGGKRKHVANAALGIFKLLHFHLEKGHANGETVSRLTCRTNWLATGHVLHVLEHFLLSALNVEIDQERYYVSPDHEKYEPKPEEIPGDILKRVKEQILTHYNKMVRMMTKYPDFEDEFRYTTSSKGDREFPYNHYISRKAATVLLDLISRIYTMARIDENEASMMTIDGELMDMLEKAAANK